MRLREGEIVALIWPDSSVSTSQVRVKRQKVIEGREAKQIETYTMGVSVNGSVLDVPIEVLRNADVEISKIGK